MSDSNNLFDQYLTRHLSHLENPSSFARRKQALDFNYKRYLPKNRDARLLDIGPGFGELLDLLANDYKYTNVHAVDLSEEVVNVCNSVVPNSTELTNDTIKFLQQRIGQFDCIFLIHVLEHIPKSDTIAFLTAIHQALAPNGKLIVEVPNVANPVTGMNVRYADFTHQIGFTDRSLMYVLKTASFSDTNVFGCRVPTTSASQIAQAMAQATVEMLLKLLTKAYMPFNSSILSFRLGAVASK